MADENEKNALAPGLYWLTERSGTRRLAMVGRPYGDGEDVAEIGGAGQLLVYPLAEAEYTKAERVVTAEEQAATVEALRGQLNALMDAAGIGKSRWRPTTGLVAPNVLGLLRSSLEMLAGAQPFGPVSRNLITQYCTTLCVEWDQSESTEALLEKVIGAALEDPGLGETEEERRAVRLKAIEEQQRRARAFDRWCLPVVEPATEQVAEWESDDGTVTFTARVPTKPIQGQQADETWIDEPCGGSVPSEEDRPGWADGMDEDQYQHARALLGMRRRMLEEQAVADGEVNTAAKEVEQIEAEIATMNKALTVAIGKAHAVHEEGEIARQARAKQMGHVLELLAALGVPRDG